MSTSVAETAADLLVVLDVRHPLAYLALEPTRALVDRLGLSADWRPLQAQTLRPPSQPRPNDDRSIRHRRHRARMIAREIAVYGEAQGLEIREPYRDGPADAAHMAWLYLAARAPHRLPDFLRVLFRDYWALALDAGDPRSVAERIRVAGLDDDDYVGWVEDAGRVALAANDQALRERGIGQTPAYQLGEEIFFGRQHLPMIEWLASGRSGTPPI